MTLACRLVQCVFTGDGPDIYCSPVCILKTQRPRRKPPKHRTVEERSYDICAQMLEDGDFPSAKKVATIMCIGHKRTDLVAGRRRALIEFGYVLDSSKRRYVRLRDLTT